MLSSLSPSEQAFIRAHLTDDIRALSLRKQPAGLNGKKLVAQIAARQKARQKLPTWYAHEELLFPPALSVEQASSEQTARYKASLVSGRLLHDLTGGMGVDTWAFAQRIGQVVYVEQQPELAALAAFNLPRLGTPNVVIQTGDSMDLLEQSDAQEPDWIYLDPHRRNEQGGKVVRLEDCEPDVSRIEVLENLLAKTNYLLLKTSPLLDIKATINQLASRLNGTLVSPVEAVHVVAVDGEVKEVLFVLRQERTLIDNTAMMAINLLADRPVEFEFSLGSEPTTAVTFSDPMRYIYEPNAAVLKAGAFRSVAARFGFNKLAPNSHLYTSDDLKPDFPGRIFMLQESIKPDAKRLRMLIPTMKANLTVRNFPQSVAELRKQLNLREGGTVYILATTLLNGDKRLLVTEKVDQSG